MELSRMDNGRGRQHTGAVEADNEQRWESTVARLLMPDAGKVGLLIWVASLVDCLMVLMESEH